MKIVCRASSAQLDLSIEIEEYGDAISLRGGAARATR